MGNTTKKHHSQSFKVLVVEDDSYWITCWRNGLSYIKEDIALLVARTVGEASTLFDAYRNEIDLIVVDACVPGHAINTKAFVSELCNKFYGPIIAISNSDIYRAELRKAGCTREAQKHALIPAIIEILEQQQNDQLLKQAA